jgi:RNA polymerase sigma-54 factor
MQLGFSQQMKMSQQMKLAPRMIQSMEILQLATMALQERIEKELSENVTLEYTQVEPEAVEGEPVPTATEAAAEKPLEQRELVVDNEHNNDADFERLASMPETEWPEDDYSYSPRISSNQTGDDADRQTDMMANIETRPESLEDHLMEQFRFFKCSAVVREFGEYLIQNLDHNGRLSSSLEEMIQVFGSSISKDDAQEALNLIQRLEPAGVGARSLEECLLLQIRPQMPYRDILIALITSHLDDLAQNRLPVIERKTGYPIDLIKDAWEELKELEPRPGRSFISAPAGNVIPDLSILPDGDGRYIVQLEDEYTPRLNISRRHIQMLSDPDTDPKTREWIKRKIESAKWLIESIEQRYNTIKRVAQAIVDYQKEFLDKGPEFIVPLKMQQIADVVGVHVTTVSRAVDDKYVQTPRGIFALKKFFGGGTTTSDGDEVAWDIIRIKLKEIVAKEDKNNPMSDDDLVKELAKVGYNLARRTVTKYRKALDIPSSRQRRAY